MDCAKANTYLEPYIDEALPAAYVRELEQHLQNCPDCASRLAELQALSTALRSLPPYDLPPGFTQAFHDKLAAEPKPKQLPLLRRGWARSLAAAAVLVAVVGLATLGADTLRLNKWVTGSVQSAPTATMASSAPSMPDAVYEQIEIADYGMIYPGEVYYDYDMADEAAYNKYFEGGVEWESQQDIQILGGMSEMPVLAEETAGSTALRMTGGSGAAEQDAAEPVAEQVERKIIRDASLSLKVDDFSAAYQRLNELAGRYGGYVVYSDAMSFGAEEMQRGSITLRVEAHRLEEALAEIESLGKVENRNIYTQDITMEYYDIAGRLNQYQAQEKRLLAILDKAETAEDLVTVERELTRIRVQLESLTGQLRYYDQMTALSSISISLYQPEAYTQTVRLGGWPGFMQDIREGFISGVNRLIRSASALVVGLARLLPLLLALAVVAAVIVPVVLARRKRRK